MLNQNSISPITLGQVRIVFLFWIVLSRFHVILYNAELLVLFAFLVFCFVVQKYGSAGIHMFFSEMAARHKRETATPLAFFVEVLLSDFENTVGSFLKKSSVYHSARVFVFFESRYFVSWVSPFWQDQKCKQALLWAVACVRGYTLSVLRRQRHQLVSAFYTSACIKKITTLSGV